MHMHAHFLRILRFIVMVFTTSCLTPPLFYPQLLVCF